MGLYHALINSGKKVIIVNEGGMPDKYGFLDPENIIRFDNVQLPFVPEVEGKHTLYHHPSHCLTFGVHVQGASLGLQLTTAGDFATLLYSLSSSPAGASLGSGAV